MKNSTLVWTIGTLIALSAFPLKALSAEENPAQVEVQLNKIRSEIQELKGNTQL
jgi:hypothetical protein